MINGQKQFYYICINEFIEYEIMFGTNIVIEYFQRYREVKRNEELFHYVHMYIYFIYNLYYIYNIYVYVYMHITTDRYLENKK